MTAGLLNLPPHDRRDIYRAAENRLGLPARLIEKDVWICWALRTTFANNKALPMAFKGGTSLSKVYSAISRFSEDLDISVKFDEMPDRLPNSRSQRDKLSTALRSRISHYVASVVQPHLTRTLDEESLVATVMLDGLETLVVTYPSCFDVADDYIAAQVKLEFGARNRISPSETHNVHTYIAELNLSVDTPTAAVNVLSPARTFWEKVTLIHAECGLSEWRRSSNRIARHWYDLAALANHRIAELALSDRALLSDVVAIKTAFWSRATAEYAKCLSGECRLVPEGSLIGGLQSDYELMIRAGMFAETPPTFAEVIRRLRVLEARINEVVAG